MNYSSIKGDSSNSLNYLVNCLIFNILLTKTKPIHYNKTLILKSKTNILKGFFKSIIYHRQKNLT